MQAVAVIKNRNMRKGFSDDIADEDGTPRCLGGQAMTFLGYSDSKLKYRCPTGGCRLKGRQGVLYCDTQIEIDPQENLRRFSLIPRRSKEWRALYSKRQSVGAMLLPAQAAPGAGQPLQARTAQGHTARADGAAHDAGGCGRAG